MRGTGRRNTGSILVQDENDKRHALEEAMDWLLRLKAEPDCPRAAEDFKAWLDRSERNRSREMNTRLMKIYEDITFSAAKDSDIKRENANIDGDTAMGSMLKFGSEGSKQFYDMYILDPRHAQAHREVIARFGRFPHRNAALGRLSTPDEQAWLDAGGGF